MVKGHTDVPDSMSVVCTTYMHINDPVFCHNIKRDSDMANRFIASAFGIGGCECWLRNESRPMLELDPVTTIDSNWY